MSQFDTGGAKQFMADFNTAGQEGFAPYATDIRNLNSLRDQKTDGVSFNEALISFARIMGYMRSNRFCVYLENPPSAVGMLPLNNQRLSLNCLQATIPDSSFKVIEQVIAGPKRNIPYSMEFGDTTAQFQFTCGVDLYEYIYFRNWQRSIIDPLFNYIAYYDDYAKNCRLTTFLVPNHIKNYNQLMEGIWTEEIYGVTMSEVYPRTVNLNAVQNSSTNISLVANVTFGFRKIVPFKSEADDIKYALNAAEISMLNTTDNTNLVDESLLRGIKKEYSPDEIRQLKSMYLAKEPLGAKLDAGRPNYDKYILPSKDPTKPPNAGDANVTMNNLITSGINIAALFQGI